MMQKSKKLSTSMSCPAISFSKSAGSGQTYRSIQAEASSSFCVQPYSINELPGPSTKSATSSSQYATTSMPSKSCSVIQFSLNSATTTTPPNFPPSKATSTPALMIHSAFEPLDILCTDMESELDLDLDIGHQTKQEEEEETDIDSDVMMSPLSMQGPASLVPASSSFKFCNELNSYLVDNSDCFQVLNSLRSILLPYNDDIDFNIDYQHQRIDGLVFLSHYCVFWMICVHEEPQKHDEENNTHQHKQTRVEFRRTSGDALASAKFWSEIKTLLQRQTAPHRPVEHDQEEQPMGFISLDLSVTAMDADLPELHFEDGNNEHAQFSKREVDQLTEALVENDLFVIDELQFLYESMMKDENVCYEILAHKPLIAQLVNHSMVNQDVCVMRSALLILSLLSQIHANGICRVDGLRLFENLNVLLNHQRPLIKKYAIRLLARLSEDECEWKIQENSRNTMIQNVRKYETQFANNLATEIRKISQKLMTTK